jgi:two-component system, sensor histidine kinase YesM
MRRVILGYAVLIAAPALLVGIVVNSWMTATALSRAAQALTDRVEQWRSAVTTGAVQVESIGEVLQFNTAFTRYLSGAVMDRADRVIQYRQEVVPLLAFARALSPYVKSIRVYAQDDGAAGLGTGFYSWDSLQPPIRERAGDIGYTGEWEVARSPSNDGAHSSDVDIALRYYRVIYDDVLHRQVAIVAMDVDASLLTDAIESIVEQGTTAVVADRTVGGSDEAVIVARQPTGVSGAVEPVDVVTMTAPASPAPAVTQVARSASGRMLLAVVDVPAPSLRLLLGTPRRLLLRDLLPVRLLAAATVPVVLLLLSWVYYFVYYSWSRRIIKLTEHIRESSHDQLKEFEDEQANDEVGVLVHHYNDLIERIRRLLDSLRIAEVRQREAAFRVLLSQMNPHFLYNALESIRMMAEAGRNEDAAEMTYLLGRFSRYSLSNTSMISSVKAEAEHADHYLAIHRRRMGERLRYVVDVAPEAQAAKCPRFIVQPIVENSIKHGIGNRRGGGEITLSALVTGEYLEIHIQDDGRGIDPTTLGLIRDRLTAAHGLAMENGYTELEDGGIGLVNVHERVVAFAGPGSGLSIAGAPDQGTRVVIRIRRAQS